MEWLLSFFRELSAELVFLALCIAGAIISGFSLLFGGDGDHEGHFDLHAEGAEGGDVEHDDGGDHSHEGPKLFSVRGISLFLTGFGGAGYLVQHYTHKTLVASAGGFVAGLVLAMVGILFIRMFFHQQASSLVSDTQIKGSRGIVLTTIPAGQAGFGEVNLNVNGAQVTLAASTEAANAIPSGSSVTVVRSMGHAVLVNRTS